MYHLKIPPTYDRYELYVTRSHELAPFLLTIKSVLSKPGWKEAEVWWPWYLHCCHIFMWPPLKLPDCIWALLHHHHTLHEAQKLVTKVHAHTWIPNVLQNKCIFQTSDAKTSTECFSFSYWNNDFHFYEYGDCLKYTGYCDINLFWQITQQREITFLTFLKWNEKDQSTQRCRILTNTWNNMFCTGSEKWWTSHTQSP